MPSPKYLSGDDIADIKNARGCGVPWERLAGHYGTRVDDLKQACGEPSSKQAAADGDAPVDLWRADQLGDQL